MEKKNIVSIAIATFNEEKNLSACLASVVDWSDDVVVVDGGSSDRTAEIATSFGARVIKTSNPPIFHINKQKALDVCVGEWILQLDADEIVSDKLREEIISVIHERRKENGFYLPRKNFFCGHFLRKGGQYPDYVIRLIRAGHAHFPSKSVHEQIAVDGPIGYLKHPLLHYSYDSIAQYWHKANIYIDLRVDELKRERLPMTPLTWFTYNFTKPITTFFLIFIRHKGFIDGYWGFVFALFSAMHHPIAYMRYVKNPR